MVNSNTNKNIFKKVVTELKGAVIQMPRFAPVWFTISFILLLYIRNLGQKWYQSFIPTLLIYGLGATLLGSLHRFLALSHQKYNIKIIEVDPEKRIEESYYLYPNNEITIPKIYRITIYILHILWFGAFVWYLIHHKIICI